MSDLIRQKTSVLVVGVDGYSGAGKSTFAELFADRLHASIVHVDDFYADLDPVERLAFCPVDGYERYFDWRRLRRVLKALRDGESLTFDRFDWSSGAGFVASQPIRVRLRAPRRRERYKNTKAAGPSLWIGAGSGVGLAEGAISERSQSEERQMSGRRRDR